MKIPFSAGLLIIATLGAVAAGDAVAGEPREKKCDDRDLRGAYGIQMQGTRPSGPGGPIESVIGVVVRYYDGNGGITQIDNIKGAISGIVPDRFGSGTYHVDEDCSFVTEFQPAPGIFIREAGVIVDHGNEVRTITSAPLPIMVTSVGKKM
jgi:hypothetical protein